MTSFPTEATEILERSSFFVILDLPRRNCGGYSNLGCGYCYKDSSVGDEHCHVVNSFLHILIFIFSTKLSSLLMNSDPINFFCTKLQTKKFPQITRFSLSCLPLIAILGHLFKQFLSSFWCFTALVATSIEMTIKIEPNREPASLPHFEWGILGLTGDGTGQGFFDAQNLGIGWGWYLLHPCRESLSLIPSLLPCRDRPFPSP